MIPIMNKCVPLFIVLAGGLFLFAPYIWEVDLSEENSLRQNGRLPYLVTQKLSLALETFPYQQRDFIWNSGTKRVKVGDAWDSEKRMNIPLFVTASRKLITTQLMIEITLAFCGAYLLTWVVFKPKAIVVRQ